MSLRLNIGSADRHVPGFLCVDIAPPPCPDCDAAMAFDGHSNTIAARTVDLCESWPWEDSTVEEVLAYDVLEHIPRVLYRLVSFAGITDELVRYNGTVHAFSELHRILVPGGRATIEVPNAAKGVGFWQDLTHSAPFCLSTFKYLESGAFAHTRLGKAYGVPGGFKVLSLTESRSNGENPAEEVWKIKAVLECVK